MNLHESEINIYFCKSQRVCDFYCSVIPPILTDREGSNYNLEDCGNDCVAGVHSVQHIVKTARLLCVHAMSQVQ